MKLFIALLCLTLAGCGKPKHVIGRLCDMQHKGERPSALGNDFFTKDGRHPCIIIIPPGHEMDIFGKVFIQPTTEGGPLSGDPEIQSYNCHFETSEQP